MLTKRTPGAMRPAHASLAFAGLMWVLPFLHYHHDYPLLMFYQEWGAAMLGLCAMLLLVAQRCWRQPEIPRIVMLPAGLMLLVLVQFALGRVTYLDQALLFALYMLWAALLMMLGQRLREELGLPALAAALAVFLLLGAELNALAGVLQHYRWHTFLDTVVVVKTGSAVFGNMAQPNHFADYLALGLISLGLLRTHWRMRAWQVALLAAPLLFVLTLSGSRSPWLYLLCLAGMAFLWQRRNKSNLPLLHYSLALLLGFGLMHLVVQIPWLAGPAGSVTSAQRLAEEFGSNGAVSSGSIRLHIWHEAWLIFTQFPLLGAGFGQFAWQHFLLGPELRNAGITGLYNNAHNLVLQIAAEMGLSGLLILLGTLALWFWQARSAQRTIYHWWGYGLLAVLGIHSLLEYPLWYAYFLGVAALTLGMLDTTAYRPELREKCPLPDETPSHSTMLSKNDNQVAGYNPLNETTSHSTKLPKTAAKSLVIPEGEGTAALSPASGRELERGLMGRLSVAAMLLLGLLSLSQMLYLYKYRNFNFETLANAIFTTTDDSYAYRVRIQLMYDNMVAAQGHALLLRPYVELFLGEVEWDHVADKGALNGRVMRYMPINQVAYREALLLAQGGRQAEARAQMERAIWAWPDEFPAALEELRALADTDAGPAHFAALLEFALQKYEERRGAAHKKS